MVAPPLLAGAVNATVAVSEPVAVAVPIVGAPGTEAVVTLFDDVLAPPVPAPLVAVTANVYAVLWASPVMLIGDAPVPVKPPGVEVAVYPETAALPVLDDAV